MNNRPDWRAPAPRDRVPCPQCARPMPAQCGSRCTNCGYKEPCDGM